MAGLTKDSNLKNTIGHRRWCAKKHSEGPMGGSLHVISSPGKVVIRDLAIAFARNNSKANFGHKKTTFRWFI